MMNIMKIGILIVLITGMNLSLAWASPSCNKSTTGGVPDTKIQSAVSNPAYTNYDMSPRIVLANKETEIVITPRSSQNSFSSMKNYRITYVPIRNINLSGKWSWDQRQKTPKLVNGSLKLYLYFEGEQEHMLRLEEVSLLSTKLLGDFRVYSVFDDLYEKTPLKGEMHSHTNRSDGVEEPKIVAGTYRKYGYDFLAITDHYLYAPSIEAINFYQPLNLDFKLFPGEEVQPLEMSYVHTVSFGASTGIANLMLNRTQYLKEVDAIQSMLPAAPAGVSARDYAILAWVYTKIRENGGMSILAHPYWQYNFQNYPSEPLLDCLLERRHFDAYEIISGYSASEQEFQNLQVTRYYEEYFQGRKLPVVGNGDTHGVNTGTLFNWYFSLVFSPSADLSDIIQSVKSLNSVAVTQVNGASPTIYGPHRLIKYGNFLLREVFPEHHVLCNTEGDLMLQYANGNTAAGTQLQALKGQTSAYWKHIKGLDVTSAGNPDLISDLE